jgi:hypothetical protein
VPSTVPAVKKGVRNWLRTQSGLTPANDVSIHGRSVVPGEDTVILAGVTAPQAFVYMGAAKEETPTLTGYVDVGRPGNNDEGEDAARDRAYQILGYIETAFRTDPTAGGVVPGPGLAEVVEGDLEEGPGDEQGSGTCRSRVRFLIRWLSDF